MSYDGSTFIGKLEELCLSGLPLVVVVGRACVCACVLNSGGSRIDGDSILIAQQPKAVDGV